MRIPSPIFLLLAFSALACDQGTLDPSVRSGLVEPTVAAGVAGEPEVNHDLASVRAATAQFHNFDKAVAAGYGVQLTPCFEQLPDGAQGYHYGNPSLIDDVVSVLEPEVLLYEPQASGRLRLVGIEYIVPLNFDEPDPLFGQHFHANPGAGVWALHVWNWRQNPTGMFEDWNPKVSCAHAD